MKKSKRNRVWLDHFFFGLYYDKKENTIFRSNGNPMIVFTKDLFKGLIDEIEAHKIEDEILGGFDAQISTRV